MKIKVKEITLYALLGALMLAGDILLEALPNVHLVGTLIVAATISYRAKALFPVYVYVFLNGLVQDLGLGGFLTFTCGRCFGEWQC